MANRDFAAELAAARAAEDWTAHERIWEERRVADVARDQERLQFTRAVTADSAMVTLSLLIKPDTDLDDRFTAWDTEEQEFIKVNGWLFTIEDSESDDNGPMPAENAVPSRFETVTGTAPSDWAVYFINGDCSHMSDAEIAQADAFADWLGGNIVDCEDAGFCHHHDATQFGVGGADCQTFTALIDRETVQ